MEKYQVDNALGYLNQLRLRGLREENKDILREVLFSFMPATDVIQAVPITEHNVFEDGEGGGIRTSALADFKFIEPYLEKMTWKRFQDIARYFKFFED